MLDGSVKVAGVFARFVASVIDAFAFWGWLIVSVAFIGVRGIGPFLTLALLVGGFVLWLRFLGRGVTPGKAALGIHVARTDGTEPGIPTMLLREFIGKWVSGLLFGLGWIWAVFDRDRQAWHDKIAGTVVVRRAGGTVPALA